MPFFSKDSHFPVPGEDGTNVDMTLAPTDAPMDVRARDLVIVNRDKYAGGNSRIVIIGRDDMGTTIGDVVHVGQDIFGHTNATSITVGRHHLGTVRLQDDGQIIILGRCLGTVVVGSCQFSERMERDELQYTIDGKHYDTLVPGETQDLGDGVSISRGGDGGYNLCANGAWVRTGSFENSMYNFHCTYKDSNGIVDAVIVRNGQFSVSSRRDIYRRWSSHIPWMSGLAAGLAVCALWTKMKPKF